ncbi:hypothetical protein C0Q70_00813 [Pomacea canaliculata]|uniref:FAD-dependent oxidoreductase domain-containing protein 2 n=1 Tax=Pomacea canaliculata TaxID=400727 RepID=A0A2T7PXQ0_POMCA|nr:hypothetical protein C0Q70_00813 [Pomacea canaliculata]
MTPRVSSLNALTSLTVALTVIIPWAFLLLLLTPPSFALTSEPHHYHDYCIVGAGPAGLQLGFFLKRAGRDYIVFERSNTTGQFFIDYPRHRKLISINKRHTGKTNKEFNLRHDWNSLLSDDESLLFRHYSKEMFPHADQLLRYLRDYQQRLGIKVQFSTEISNIHSLPDDTMPDGVLYYMNDQLNNSYSCKVLIIATGMGKPNIPDMKGIEYAEGYESLSLHPEDYEGKSVLVLGRGNSAFEVADGIYGVTNLIHMVARSRVRLSWETHYVGDLRGVNNALLDTYQLKSLDGLLEADLTEVQLAKRDGKVFIEPLVENMSEFQKIFGDNFALREPYDKVLRCLGFSFDSSLFQDGESVHYFEEFPINMLHEFTNSTGFPVKQVLVLVMEYGSEFSGPGKDIFRYDRATGDPGDAHNSNFLHPVLYYYDTVPTKMQMKTKGKQETLPRPAAMHHIVEDFLTLWDRPFSHIMPLRHFLDHITKTDLRDRFSQACFFEAMTHDSVGLLCKQRYLMGQGLSATPEMIVETDVEGLWPK